MSETINLDTTALNLAAVGIDLALGPPLPPWASTSRSARRRIKTHPAGDLALAWRLAPLCEVALLARRHD